ncbi:hypothetical protein Hanom_Chr12g01132661 [Helianthus anomalus]
MWNLIYFQSITYFLYIFFSMCAFLKKKPTLFLRLGSGRGRCASPAPCVFDNIAVTNGSDTNWISTATRGRNLLVIKKNKDGIMKNIY